MKKVVKRISNYSSGKNEVSIRVVKVGERRKVTGQETGDRTLLQD